jgi:hypothetical protein
MAYQYADYASQATPALRLARARLHLAELSQQIGPDVSQDGSSRSAGSITSRIVELNAEIQRMERQVNGSGRAARMRRR